MIIILKRNFVNSLYIFCVVLCNMTRIQTYVFLDLETSGKDQSNRTKITEISLIAVKRQHFLDTRIGHSPRVQHKLTLCVNPRKLITPDATVATGLCNDLLEFEPIFDKNLINLLNLFIDLLTKPVCLIAQNGMNFDFPILKNHLEKMGLSFADDVACADCLYAFYDIMESSKVNETEFSTPVKFIDIKKESNVDTGLNYNTTSDIQLRNEKSPTHLISSSLITPKKPSHVRQLDISRYPWSGGKKPKEKYKLAYIYKRLLNRPAQNPHQAESDCILALECAVALSEKFVTWVDENNYLFSQIKPMTIGAPLGM